MSDHESKSKTPTALIVLLVAAVAGVVLCGGGFVALRWMWADMERRDEQARAEIAERAAERVAAEAERSGTKLYFPTTVGATWVMEVKGDGRKPFELTGTVIRVEEKDGVYTVTTEFEQGESVYEVSAKGVFGKSVDKEGKKEPRPVLKLGGKPGDTWEEEWTSRNGQPVRATSTLGGEEVVQVPAGKFTALRVVSDCEQDGSTWRVTTWYAAGVGKVKQRHEVNTLTITQEMKSFTPGEGKQK